jgi:hypothetical protein
MFKDEIERKKQVNFCNKNIVLNNKIEKMLGDRIKNKNSLATWI